MRTISFFFVLIQILQISQQQNIINNETLSQNKNEQQKKEEAIKIQNQNNIQQNKTQQSTNNNQNITNNTNKNNNIQNNLTNIKKVEIPKKDNNNRGINPKEDKKEKDKNFNLTESLIKFFNENFGQKNESVNNTKPKTQEEIEQMKRQAEAEMQQKLLRERDQKRREYFEQVAKAELIRIENQKKEEKRRKEQEEKLKFENLLANTTFDEIIQIAIEKGETESLYLNLASFTKIKIAVFLTDEDERIHFVLSGPNARGRTSALYRADNRNYLFYEYETLRNGEYIIDLINKGSKENELVFLISGTKNKKKDNIDTEKIDKISLLLNNIDNNINQLRNKKKMEILKINTHNEKVDENNKYIIIYSIIEIFTMIIIFVSQSYYISSLVTKI